MATKYFGEASGFFERETKFSEDSFTVNVYASSSIKPGDKVPVLVSPFLLLPGKIISLYLTHESTGLDLVRADYKMCDSIILKILVFSGGALNNGYCFRLE